MSSDSIIQSDGVAQPTVQRHSKLGECFQVTWLTGSDEQEFSCEDTAGQEGFKDQSSMLAGWIDCLITFNSRHGTKTRYCTGLVLRTYSSSIPL